MAAAAVAKSLAAVVLLTVQQVESIDEVHVVVALLLLPVVVFVHILVIGGSGDGSGGDRGVVGSVFVVGVVISGGIGLLMCVFKYAGGRQCMERGLRQQPTN